MSGEMRDTPEEFSVAQNGSEAGCVNEPIKIIFLVTTLGWGGTERNLVQYCETLDANKWSIEVWYLHESEESLRGRLENSGIVTKCLNAPKKFRLWFLIALGRKLAKAKVDLIHVFLPTVGYYAVVSKFLFRSRTPMMYSSGGVQFLLPLQRPMMQYGLGRYCYPIAGNSNAVAGFLEDMGIDRRRIRVIRNGHDLSKLETPLDRFTYREKLGAVEDDFLITTVGRLIDTKRHTDLLRALAKIDPQEVPFKLLVVGDGPLMEQIATEAEELGIGARIKMLGQRDDVISILRCSDLFVFPSSSEGLPNAVIEAALCKLPIVASDIDPVLEIIDDGRSGWIVPVEGVEEICLAIKEAAGNPAFAKQLAAAAYDDATSTFDLHNTIRLLESAYYDAIGGFHANS